ncbi:MAG: hypothetical protein K6F64_03095 [Clostridia bacterium]|nr:hypothetical protein [Clostridia bacterium]
MSITLVLAVFASCGKKEIAPKSEDEAEEEESAENLLRLAYSKNDSLDPYEMETELNYQISSLVFDGLFKLDKSYKPQPCIAQGGIVAESGITVTLNDVSFSDGSKVTATDIISSFNKAKESDIYSPRLDNIESASASSSTMVLFKLSSPDPYALACLDFPIVKFDRGEDELPIGSGRYLYAKSYDNLYLVVNVNKTGFNPLMKTIALEPVHESESVESSLVIGGKSFSYNNLSSGEFSRIDALSYEVVQNNLVFLGFNEDSEFFSDPLVRKGVSTSLDRDAITTSAFQYHAVPTALPFNPSWYALEAKISELKFSEEDAKTYLKESDVEPESGEVVLLCNRENEFKYQTAVQVKSMLENVGFFVRLKDYNEEDYVNELKYGTYDLFIGEIKLSADMNLRNLYDIAAPYDEDVQGTSLSRYIELLKGECEIMDYINSFNEDFPFIPLCFRDGIASFTKSMQVKEGFNDVDVFYDIESWSIK